MNADRYAQDDICLYNAYHMFRDVFPATLWMYLGQYDTHDVHEPMHEMKLDEKNRTWYEALHVSLSRQIKHKPLQVCFFA